MQKEEVIQSLQAMRSEILNIALFIKDERLQEFLASAFIDLEVVENAYKGVKND